MDLFSADLFGELRPEGRETGRVLTMPSGIVEEEGEGTGGAEEKPKFTLEEIKSLLDVITLLLEMAKEVGRALDAPEPNLGAAQARLLDGVTKASERLMGMEKKEKEHGN